MAPTCPMRGKGGHRKRVLCLDLQSGSAQPKEPRRAPIWYAEAPRPGGMGAIHLSVRRKTPLYEGQTRSVIARGQPCPVDRSELRQPMRLLALSHRYERSDGRTPASPSKWLQGLRARIHRNVASPSGSTMLTISSISTSKPDSATNRRLVAAS